MLRLNYFFDGVLKKEEAASAFLAMALNGVPSFREYFFGALSIPAAAQVDFLGQVWKPPAIERDRVDLRPVSRLMM